MRRTVADGRVDVCRNAQIAALMRDAMVKGVLFSKFHRIGNIWCFNAPCCRICIVFTDIGTDNASGLHAFRLDWTVSRC